MCTGATSLSSSCIDISIYLAPTGSTGGLLHSNRENSKGLIIENGNLKKVETEK